MLVEILIAILIGIVCGIISGITPGIHINLISVLILTFSPFLLIYFSPLALASLIIAMGIIHTFLDAIPSIFLGAPTEETAISILPGHRMLLEGKGYEAVMLTIFGTVTALIISFLFIPLALVLFPLVYEKIKIYIGIILLFIIGFLLLKEKSKLFSLMIFLMAGVLGIATLNMGIKNVLFPLLSGLFGISTLIISLKDKPVIPKQKITFPKLDKSSYKVSFISFITGAMCSFMPGLGPAQGAVLGSQFIKKIQQKDFLILVGGLSAVNFFLSLISLYKLEKARNGAVAIVLKLVNTINLKQFLILVSVTLIVLPIAVLLSVKLSKAFSFLITKVNYQKLCLSIILFILILTIFLCGIPGFLILLLSTLIGVIPQLANTPKNHLMGCLILPVLFYFL
ncbi:MAG: tripartite tricarboxylate transporter permease [Candidatus Nanoarchaeia archaeon]|nr:tripartite tricarboxylate transporter permease [Candidatus Nanoarchaeia archaeon]